LLTPKYCYEENYPQLRQLTPTIIAVDKLKEFNWKNK
jgi:hypothetical protein